MKKTLFLVRHAKATRKDPAEPDRGRPLEDSGRHDATAMGKRLADRKVKPDLLLSSPAVRALETAQRIADELGFAHKDIMVDERLYASSADDLLAVVRALDDALGSVMLFGHNPEFTDLAHRLSAEITDMPTCAVAKFRYETQAWADVGDITPSKVSLDSPGK